MTAPTPDRCPSCGTPTIPRTAGGRTHQSLCFACTEFELGHPWAEEKKRINELLAKGRKRRWVR